MKDQIDVLRELQERVLIKGGVCAFSGMQDFVRNEALMPTAMENGIAWPHVRMEGGPLTVAIGRSRLGFDWHGRKVRYVFLAATDRGTLWRAILKATRVTTK